MMTWKAKKDVITWPGNAKTMKTKDSSKMAAAAKCKTQMATGWTRRSSGAMTQRMKDYKQLLAPKANDDEEDEDNKVKLISVNDENADPGGPKANNEGVVVPNMLPIPAFIVAALMRTYASNAATLCLAAIDAIKERAIRAG